MSEKIGLTKNVYNKQQFEKTVDTSFSELGVNQASTDTTTTPTLSVDEFFKYYQDLFFTIPKEGAINSHRYLIDTSTDYAGEGGPNLQIEALLQEINSLRDQVLTQEQLLLTLRSTQDTLSRTS